MANVSLQNFIRVWKFIISRIVIKMNVVREDLVERERVLRRIWQCIPIYILNI